MYFNIHYKIMKKIILLKNVGNYIKKLVKIGIC